MESWPEWRLHKQQKYSRSYFSCKGRQQDRKARRSQNSGNQIQSATPPASQLLGPLTVTWIGEEGSVNKAIRQGGCSDNELGVTRKPLDPVTTKSFFAALQKQEWKHCVTNEVRGQRGAEPQWGEHDAALPHSDRAGPQEGE